MPLVNLTRRAYHAAALALAIRIGARYEQARAHHGFAHTYQIGGDPDQARYHWQQSRTLYSDIGVPDADAVHACLTALDQAADDESRPGHGAGDGHPYHQ